MVSSAQELSQRDVIVAQRTCNDQANPVLWALTDAGVPWTYDIDDMLWGVDPTNVAAYGFYAQGWVQDTLRRTVAAAAQVSVSTPELGDALVTDLGYSGPVEVLPNTVAEVPGLTREPEDEPVDPDGKRVRPLRVLWAGSRTHDEDLKIIRYATKKMVERGEIEFVIMGVEYRDLIPWASGQLGWVNNNEYLQALAGLHADVMLCPVKPTAFNACKSHLKALDAMAAGIIPLASDFVTYNRLVTDGVDGMLAKWNEQDWYKKLRTLANMSWDELKAMRSNGLRRALEYHSDNWAEHVYDFWGAAPTR
jgi:glycosyltransferase involved in cell wall biosynthesis